MLNRRTSEVLKTRWKRPGPRRIAAGTLILIAAIGGMIYWQFWLKPPPETLKSETLKSGTPQSEKPHAGATQCGVASWYALTGLNAEGRKEDPAGMFAAHRTLPLGTHVRVLDRDNGKSVDVTINDRGPFVKGRILDLTKGAAERLGMIDKGTANVKITVIGDIPAHIKDGDNCKS